MSILGTFLGNVAGKLVNSAIDSHYQHKAMKQQEELQEKLFEFENSNKHQFEVSDLRAAGLNPILSAMNGSAVGVGGVSMSNFSSEDDSYSAAKQIELQKSQQKIEQQNADANTKNADTNQSVGVSQVGLNSANAALATANANTAIAMKPWLEKQKQTEIDSLKVKTAAEVAYYGALGAAAQLQASAAAADHYQNIKESQERSLGYAGQREGQYYSNEQKRYDIQYNNWKRDLEMGRRSPATAYDVMNRFQGK